MTQPSLALTFTDAGLARFTAAQLGNAIDLTVAQVGLTDAAFVVAPTLTALPNEFRRIDTISGKAVGGNVVHMTIRDDAAITYGVRGLGLFLADGTLLAVVGQADRIFTKAAIASFLIAIDIAFPTPQIDRITFGATDFLYPPATEDTKGVARLAAQALVDQGEDAASIVTPRTLKARLLAAFQILGEYIPKTQRGTAGGVATLGEDARVPASQLPAPPVVPVQSVNGQTGAVILTPLDVGAPPRALRVAAGGVATGGGPLEDDVEIRVTAATPEEVRAGTATDLVVTPAGLAALAADFAATGEYQVAPGVFHKTGTTLGSFGEGGYRINFVTPFPNECLRVFVTGINSDGSNVRDVYTQRQSLSVDHFIAFVQKTGTAGDSITGFDWLAIGR